MKKIRDRLPLVVLVGPTASGKTKIAIELAQIYDGEIICADSRTVYKEMDIGTAKPGLEERQSVSHWGLDLVSPNEIFTASDFKDYANKKINEIRARGKVPFLVGGTGLYIDAVIFDYQFGPPANQDVRKIFEKMSIEELHEYCKKANIKLPENHKNKRYIIRAIEQKSINNKRRSEPIDNCYVVGIATDRDVLRKRIEKRTEQLLNDGVVKEAKKLGKKYGWQNNSMSGNIYPICREYINGSISIDELKRIFIARDMNLAKRQMTWFKRSPYTVWLDLKDVPNYIHTKLDSEH